MVLCGRRLPWESYRCCLRAAAELDRHHRGAEAWALFQATSRALLGSQFRVDCKPCVGLIQAGEAVATVGRRLVARVYRLVFTSLHDAEAVVWVLAHTSEQDIGIKLIGNGRKLTAADRDSNSLAARLAKLAVEEHRVPSHLRSVVNKHELQASGRSGSVDWHGRRVGQSLRRGPRSRHGGVPEG